MLSIIFSNSLANWITCFEKKETFYASLAGSHWYSATRLGVFPATQWNIPQPWKTVLGRISCAEERFGKCSAIKQAGVDLKRTPAGPSESITITSRKICSNFSTNNSVYPGILSLFLCFISCRCMHTCARGREHLCNIFKEWISLARWNLLETIFPDFDSTVVYFSLFPFSVGPRASFPARIPWRRNFYTFCTCGNLAGLIRDEQTPRDETHSFFFFE